MTPPGDLEFAHRFEPGVSAAAPTLLLLHGTGGDENDLIPLGRQVLPGAALLSPRGRVLENGMPRFFRRFAEGVFDLEDLKRQTIALGDFIRASVGKYGIEGRRMIAMGYSNGANIAASLLLSNPRLLAGAVLFRAMVPFVPEPAPDLRDIPILLAGGRRDPVVDPSQTTALAAILESAGARVEIHWHPGGHELGDDDLKAAALWLGLWPSE